MGETTCAVEVTNPFASEPPQVELVNAFAAPYDNAVATARTCYSGSGIVTAEQVRARPDQRDRIARSIFEAGHHTTLQHAHFQFALANVSRQFLWSFLHSHPFYNSEQVSQRYVTVKPATTAIPALPAPARGVFEDTVALQHDAYQRLTDLLMTPAAREYYRLFPARAKHRDRYDRDVKKKAQEIARYVLPVATQAYLYHTVSGITLLRYWRLCEQRDASAETRYVVGRMVQELLRADPQFAKILQPPLPGDDTLEARCFAARPAGAGITAAFLREFDADLDGLTSRLVGRKADNETLVASAVREVLGLPRAQMSDEDAIRLALDPARNRLHGEAMTLTTLSKISRAMVHASYTFKKKLSHTADSQDQRHRMTPGSRPILTAHLHGEPDYITPVLLEHSAHARVLYDETMHRTWEAIARLRALGVADEWRAYLLPNAVAIRFTESADLLHLHHKLKMRLCYNAQEEIWQASVDEARQIRDVEPTIGRFLLPPCGLRAAAETRPICPEGDRYCGVPVWKLQVGQYARVI
ncbi:MAG: FAD-dependent thymidylate synthase [Deltaproteobacteria bacterium]|nr:MAG: FAD-dependent thymidylate synthase [Deltaproteobacteria bacterium]